MTIICLPQLLYGAYNPIGIEKNGVSQTRPNSHSLLPLTRNTVLGKLLNLSKPQFPHLSSGKDTISPQDHEVYGQ